MTSRRNSLRAFRFFYKWESRDLHRWRTDEKYRAETIDIEDEEFEEVDLVFDVLFPDLKQQGNDYDNQTEND